MRFRSVRVRRVLRFWPIAVVGMGGLLFAVTFWPARYTYTIGPETTYITGPLDAQGFVDYPTALNERMRGDTTPETNANVLIWQALGPFPEGGTKPMPPDYFRWLGIPSPPEEGDYLVGWDTYFKTKLGDPPDDVCGWFIDLPDLLGEGNPDGDWKQQWTERSDRAGKWPWRRADEPALADWLRGNEKPLAIMTEASRRPAYFNPLVSRSSDPGSFRLLGSLLPSVQRCREAGRVLKCRAMARLAEGDDEGAWQDLLTIQRLGRHLARGGTLIEQLVGIALVVIATDGELTVIGHHDHPAPRLRAWLADVQSLPPMPSVAEKLALGERYFGLDSMQAVVVGGVDSIGMLSGPMSAAKSRKSVWKPMVRPSINFDPAFRKFNKMYDRLQAALRLPDRAGRQLAFAQIETEIRQGRMVMQQPARVARVVYSRSGRGEAIGDILIGLLLPAIGKLQDAADRAEQTQDNLRVALALAAFRADTGCYPEELAELTPKYLPAVPGDRFSGKPLVYQPTDDGYLVYSLGVNGIDEQGRWTDDEPKGDDLRVRMPVTAPPVKRKDKPLSWRVGD